MASIEKLTQGIAMIFCNHLANVHAPKEHEVCHVRLEIVRIGAEHE